MAADDMSVATGKTRMQVGARRGKGAREGEDLEVALDPCRLLRPGEPKARPRQAPDAGHDERARSERPAGKAGLERSLQILARFEPDGDEGRCVAQAISFAVSLYLKSSGAYGFTRLPPVSACGYMRKPSISPLAPGSFTSWASL